MVIHQPGVSYIEYLQSQDGADKGGGGKVDYMKVLTTEEFAVFSKLREKRKELAVKEGVPPFVIFTDEQLSQIVKQKPDNLGKLAAIQGVGQPTQWWWRCVRL